MAASCAVASICSMLALVSSSNASARGTPVLPKNVSVLRHAVFEHEEIVAIEIGHVSLSRVGDRHAERDEIDARTKRGALRAAPAVASIDEQASGERHARQRRASSVRGTMSFLSY